MKNLAKFILVLTVIFTSSVASAQMQKRTPQERAQNQVQWMQKNLALTDDQSKKAYDIILRSARQVDNARNAPAGSGKKQDMQGIQNNRDAEMKAILSGDQYQKYQVHVQEIQEKMKERKGMQQGGY